MLHGSLSEAMISGTDLRKTNTAAQPLTFLYSLGAVGEISAVAGETFAVVVAVAEISAVVAYEGWDPEEVGEWVVALE